MNKYMMIVLLSVMSSVEVLGAEQPIKNEVEEVKAQDAVALPKKMQNTIKAIDYSIDCPVCLERNGGMSI